MRAPHVEQTQLEQPVAASLLAVIVALQSWRARISMGQSVVENEASVDHVIGSLQRDARQGSDAVEQVENLTYARDAAEPRTQSAKV